MGLFDRLSQLDADVLARVRGRATREQVARRWMFPVVVGVANASILLVLAFTLLRPMGALAAALAVIWVAWFSFVGGYWYRERLGPDGRAGWWLEGKLEQSENPKDE